MKPVAIAALIAIGLALIVLSYFLSEADEPMAQDMVGACVLGALAFFAAAWAADVAL